MTAAVRSGQRSKLPMGYGRKKLTKEEGLKLYRQLLLARLCEEKIREEYFNDEMKTPVHLGIGGEAIAVGVCHCLAPGTRTFGTYRNHTLYLTKSGDVDGFFAELYGRATGPGKGKAGSMHLMNPQKGLVATSAVVATTVPLAVGDALAQSYLKTGAMSVAFFGDGAVEEGAFWESLNFACLKRLPVLFVCEDNDLAIHTARAQRRGFASLRNTVATYDCHAAEGDGASVTNVIRLTRQVMGRMAKDPKPGFIRLAYFRFLEHVGPREDFDAGYRPRPPEQLLRKMDPVVRFEKELVPLGLRERDLAPIRAELKALIDAGVAKAKAAPFPQAAELTTDVYV
ncbi:MAG: thiamine pyrophosphate-dependent dehydrogenase E1 component subunit alpha [Elusimicrobia bacterium]|nr:thiamine pyrophosphate-dependent dehydrogenase E1 component subunit alpha [Elusimicrobiota bacterium]